MPTSYDRIEIAKRLRGGDDVVAIKAPTYAEMVEWVADLIDPTCNPVTTHIRAFGSVEMWEATCSACGAVIGDGLGEDLIKLPNYCSHCGCRVVSE